MLHRHRASIVLGAVIVLLTMRMAFAQSAQPTDTMSALLNEVRALRVAMEQQATIVPRIQLFVARINIEEQRMEQLNQQLTPVRRELAEVALKSQQEAAGTADAEKELTQTTDDKVRKEMNMLLEGHKRDQQEWDTRQRQLQAQEADLVRELGTEQARWGELNARIDELEQSLSPVRRPQ